MLIWRNINIELIANEERICETLFRGVFLPFKQRERMIATGQDAKIRVIVIETALGSGNGRPFKWSVYCKTWRLKSAGCFFFNFESVDLKQSNA